MARKLAQTLGYVYVDSGAMYRAVTLYALQKNYISQSHFNIDDLILHLDEIELTFRFNSELGFSEMHLNNVNVEQEIRSMEVSAYVSKIAEVPEIRRKLVKVQREIGLSKGLVMDGRDIGTVVFPEADLKLFLTASSKVRAKRRFDELIKKGEQVTFEEVLKNVTERDHIDSNRSDSPLRKAKDAIELDNSDMTVDGQFKIIYELVKSAIDNKDS
jgi:cytidylate kinase